MPPSELSLASVMQSNDLYPREKLAKGWNLLVNSSDCQSQFLSPAGEQWLDLYISAYLECLSLSDDVTRSYYYQVRTMLGELQGYVLADHLYQEQVSDFFAVKNQSGLTPVEQVLENKEIKTVHKLQMVTQLIAMGASARLDTQLANDLLSYLLANFSLMKPNEDQPREFRDQQNVMTGYLKAIAGNELTTQPFLNEGLSQVLKSARSLDEKFVLGACFINAGADALVCDAGGQTWLHLAVIYADSEQWSICQVFNEPTVRGNMLQVVDNQGQSALAALLDSSLEMKDKLARAKELIQYGAAATACDSLGNNYLHLYCAQKKSRYFQALPSFLFPSQELADNVKQLNHQDESALSILLNSEQSACQKVYWGLALIKAGADPSTCDKNSRNVLAYLAKITDSEIEAYHPRTGTFLDLLKRYRQFIKPMDSPLENAKRLLTNYIRPMNESSLASYFSDSTQRFFAGVSRDKDCLLKVQAVLNDETVDSVDSLVSNLIKEFIPQPDAPSSALDKKEQSSLYRRLDFLCQLYTKTQLSERVREAKGEEAGLACVLM